MTEAENLDRPVEVEAEFDDKAFDEGFGLQTPEVKEVVAQETPVTEEVSKPAEETVKDEVDYTPFLETLSKEIKFMDEEVKFNSLDEVKNNVQKGLNYERLESKLKELQEGPIMSYLNEKAKSLGLKPEEYITKVKEYEEQQAKATEEAEINEMVESGVALEIAKKVVETNKLARELQEERLRIKEEKEAEALKNAKARENEEFLKAFPEVKINEIPKEVFVEAEKSNLTIAYTKYENSKLKKQLEVYQKNQDNKNSSPVKGTTEHGGVVIEKKDPFAEGFGL